MSAWLGGGAPQTLTLKSRAKAPQSAAEDGVEEIGGPNDNFQESLHRDELPLPEHFSAALLGQAGAGGPDLAFLVQDLLQFDDFEEADQPWDFKSLKNEISHIVSRLYGSAELPDYPQPTPGAAPSSSQL